MPYERLLSHCFTMSMTASNFGPLKQKRIQPQMSEPRSTKQTIDFVIENRITEKVLAENVLVPRLTDEQIQKFDDQVLAAVQVAGWAPFHYDRRMAEVAEPFRFNVMFSPACRKLAEEFHTRFDDIKPTNKIPKMLNACGALVLVTWLAEQLSDPTKSEKVNREHLAAASAATQNLLIALQARELGTYWSSGGQLGSAAFFQSHQLPAESELVGAIFVHYPGLYDETGLQRISGKNRTKRSDWKKWTRIIE